MTKDVPFWHSFRGAGLKKLGFKLVDTESDETGEVLIFKNAKMYINPIKLVVDTQTGGFAVYECSVNEDNEEFRRPMEIEIPILAAVLDLYSELGLLNGVYNELHSFHRED